MKKILVLLPVAFVLLLILTMRNSRVEERKKSITKNIKSLGYQDVGKITLYEGLTLEANIWTKIPFKRRKGSLYFHWHTNVNNTFVEFRNVRGLEKDENNITHSFLRSGDKFIEVKSSLKAKFNFNLLKP